MTSKVRLTVDVTEDLNKLLEQVAAEKGCTKSEVFRKTVNLAVVLHQAEKEGRKVRITGDDKQPEREIVGL